jgi:phosphate/phosphite/phosphonate ABC transporter binding protein
VVWAAIAAVVALAGAAGIVWAVSLRDQRPAGVPLVFAHPPSYPEQVIKSELRPLAAYLERKVHRPVDVVTTRDYETLEDRLLAGSIDLANMPSLLYVLAKQRDPSLRALAVHAFENTETDQSYILASADSEIGLIEELEGKRFCYPDRRSTTGYLLPRRFLREKGLDPDSIFSEVVFSKGHVGVMEDIAAGRCDAGAVIATAWANARELGIKSHRLKLVAPAGETLRDVVCASPAMPASLADSLGRALLEFRADRDLRAEELGSVFVIDHFVKVRPSDFGPIESAARAEGLLQ